MQIDEIAPGANIEIEVKCAGQTMSFESKIENIINNSVLINTIKMNDQTIGFSDNCQINFLYKDNGKVYSWDDILIKLVRYGGKIYHMIDLDGEGKPYNRRDSYRIYIGEDMPLYINSPSGPTAISVLVKDISETGVGFITSEEIDINRTVRLKVKDGHMNLSLSGIIVRREFLEHLNSFIYGCKFIEKNNILGRYIAKKQTEMLRKQGGIRTIRR